jgi:xanthine dehydrogenase large subunit
VNVHRSKAVGEPPFLLGISAWTAVKNALSYQNSGAELKSPATGEEILRELTGEF